MNNSRDNKPDAPTMEEIAQIIAQGPFAATWESLAGYTIPIWYQDAKFGIFLHWGVYAVPAFASEWYPRNMYQQDSPEFKHHVATYGPHTEFGYKDFIPQFTAEHFDPDAWAALLEESGARFVMPVAEHHDGFALYDSALSDWNAAQMGPKRDVLSALADSVRARGLVFSLSNHRAEHWWFFDGGRAFPSDVGEPATDGLYAPARPAPANWEDVTQGEPPDQAFLEDWLRRACESVDRFRPGIVWFDWWIGHTSFTPYLQQFAAYYYNRAAEWGEEVAINYKYGAMPEGVGVFDIERGQLAGIRPLFWQNDTSVSKSSWGYVENHDYKDPGEIVGDLIDIVSKNGALLLNIGPKADGTIPIPEQEILRRIGGWLKINGEAIYGTRPWAIYGEGPTEVKEGAFTDSDRLPFTAQDFRFTTQGDVLYVFGLAWPETSSAVITSLAEGAAHWPGEIGSVTLLGDSSGPLPRSRDALGLSVTLPKRRVGEFAYVLKIVPK